MFPLVSVAWLNEHLKDPDLVVLDASQLQNASGSKPSLANVKIEGAVPFDLENTFSDKNHHLPHMLPAPHVFEKECRKLGINRRSTIVVYDNIGIYFSPRVWWMFKTMGHDSIAVLDGGLPAWDGAGFKMEATKKPTLHTGDFEARFLEEAVKDIKFIQSNVETQASLVIDARSAGRFNGEMPEPRVGLKKGHIPGSVNIPFTEVLQHGYYRSTTELMSLFEKFNVQDRPLVFTCGSGVTACIVLLAAELVLKNKKAVYDGSWAEWGREE